MVEVKEYTPEFEEGCIDVIRSQFPPYCNWPRGITVKKFAPIFHYDWEGCNNRHGKVLLDHGKVVGFIGGFYSNRTFEGKTYGYMNLSTWGVEDAYRKYSLDMFTEMIEDGLIIVNHTPIETVRKLSMALFDFKPFNESVYYLPPLFAVGSHGKFTFIRNPGEIDDPVVKQQFIDHQPYGLKLLKCEFPDGVLYVFYDIIHRKVKRLVKTKWSRISAISDIKIFRKYYREIIWAIQKHEWAFMEVYGRFMGDIVPESCYTIKRERIKLYRLPEGCHLLPEQVDDLYSEMVTLHEGQAEP